MSLDVPPELLRAAREILAHLPHGFRDRLRIGGGTVLAQTLKHRASKDLDFFHHDAQILGFLTPRLNDMMIIGLMHYIEQSNVIKFVFAQNEVDFIIALDVLPSPAEILQEEFFGIYIQRDSPEEIVAKKILYRGANATARDLYDLAAFEKIFPGRMASFAPFIGIRPIEETLIRLTSVENRLSAILERTITHTNEWRGFSSEVPRLARACLLSMKEAVPRAEDARPGMRAAEDDSSPPEP